MIIRHCLRRCPWEKTMKPSINEHDQERYGQKESERVRWSVRLWTDVFLISSRRTSVHLIELIYHYEPCSSMEIINKWSQSLSVVICAAGVVCVSALSASAGRSGASLLRETPLTHEGVRMFIALNPITVWFSDCTHALSLCEWLNRISVFRHCKASARCWETPSKLLRVYQWGWKHLTMLLNSSRASQTQFSCGLGRKQARREHLIFAFRLIYCIFHLWDNQTHMQCWAIWIT